METEQEAAVATETGQQTGGIAKTDQQQQSGVNAVLRQLLRGLRVAFTQTDSAQEALKDTAKHLDQIGNLAEQFQCCSRVKLSDTALARFPDVKENLIYKLGAEIDDHLQHMHGAIAVLRLCQEKVSQQSNATLDLYHRCSSQAPGAALDGVTEATPTRPAASTMMEWLVDLDQLCFELLVSKEELVKQLNYHSADSVERFQKEWSSCADLTEKLQHVKLLTTFFVEEKV